ncbi:MAG: hypothetical protein IJY04_04360 [Clostridia bacterium]|nr:hypothetical protein [Clostridia bacterium]
MSENTERDISVENGSEKHVEKAPESESIAGADGADLNEAEEDFVDDGEAGADESDGEEGMDEEAPEEAVNEIASEGKRSATSRSARSRVVEDKRPEPLVRRTVTPVIDDGEDVVVTESQDDIDYDEDKVGLEDDTDSPNEKSQNDAEKAAGEGGEKKRRRTLRELISESVLIGFLEMIFRWISTKVRTCATVYVMSHNDGVRKRFKSSLLLGFFRLPKIEAKLFKMKLYFSGLMSRSVILSGRSGVGEMVLRTPVRRVGAMLFSAGIGTVAIYYVNLFAIKTFNILPVQLYIGVLLCIPGLLMLIIGGTFLELITGSRILKTLVFGFFNSKINIKDDSPISGSMSASILAGVCVAALSIFVPLYEIIILLVLIVAAATVMKSPEMGVVGIIALVPIVEFRYIGLLMAATWISFIINCATGKRGMSFTFIDMFPLGFFLVLVLGSIVSNGSIGVDMGVFAVLASVYFLVVSLIRDAAWADRCRGVLSLDAVIISFFAIMRKLPRNPFGIDTVIYGATDMGGVMDTPLLNSGVAVLMLAMFSFVQMACIVHSDRVGRKVLYFIATLLSMIAFYAYANTVAALCFTVIMTAFLISMDKRFRYLIPSLIVFAVLMPVFGLPSVGKRLSEVWEQIQSRAHLWRECTDIVRDNLISGIGSRPDAFVSVYDGVYEVTDPGSLSVWMVLSVGIIGTLFFAACIVMFLQYCFSYGRRCSDKLSPARLQTYAGMCAIIFMLAVGCVEHVWHSYRAMAFFWVIMGTVSVVQRVYARETARDFLDDPVIIPEI